MTEDTNNEYNVPLEEVESSLDWENDPEYRKQQLDNLQNTEPEEKTDADILLNDEIIDEPTDSEEMPAEDKPYPSEEMQNEDGDVLEDQVSLFYNDDEAADDEDPNQVVFEEENDTPEVPSSDNVVFEEEPDTEQVKKNILYKIPVLSSAFKWVGVKINSVRTFFNTFYDEKYWKNPYSFHGAYVRSRMMKHGWVFLHRIGYDVKEDTYYDKMIFVKKKDLVTQEPKHTSNNGVKQIQTLNGDFLINNLKLTPAEYENEGGFTQTSAYLFMLDTSGEKAVNDSTADLSKGTKKMDKTFLILIGGAFVIIFGFFLLGGLR